MVEPDKRRITISRMLSAYCIPKATDAHTEHAIRYGAKFQTDNSPRLVTRKLTSDEYPSQTSLFLHF
jgi:hypothetical protein